MLDNKVISSQPPKPEFRITAVSVTTGFAATLFVLIIDLWQSHAQQSTPFHRAVVVTAALGFFFASVTNLLQLAIFDYLETGKWVPDDAKTLGSKLRTLRFRAWDFLVTPLILIFCLVDPALSLGVNLSYGLILYWYYFLPRP